MPGENRRNQTGWQGEWSDQQRRDRFPLIREVRCESGVAAGKEIVVEDRQGRKFSTGLTINVGNGGICLLMDRAPEIKEILRVHVPMPVTSAKTPTLAEVRWQRVLPFDTNGIYVVGLKFLL